MQSQLVSIVLRVRQVGFSPMYGGGLFKVLSLVEFEH